MPNVDKTRLTMVNRILSASSMGPVAALSPGTRESVFAEAVLDEVSQDLQGRGWYFNTVPKVSIAPTGPNVLVPADVLRMDPVDPTVQFVEVDGKMYDLVNDTDVISRTLDYRVVYYRALDELPAPVARYVVARAARVFQLRQVGDAQIDARLAEEEAVAWGTLWEHESSTSRANMLYDSFSVGRIRGRQRVNPLWYS